MISQFKSCSAGGSNPSLCREAQALLSFTITFIYEFYSNIWHFNSIPSSVVKPKLNCISLSLPFTICNFPVIPHECKSFAPWEDRTPDLGISQTYKYHALTNCANGAQLVKPSINLSRSSQMQQHFILSIIQH